MGAHQGAAGQGSWQRYVALGDSFTEGMCDPDPTDPLRWRGWADRLADELAARSSDGLQYANLAVRGRLLPEILAEQLPAALDSGPDLVSLVGGGNDVLRPAGDPDRLAASLEEAVARLRSTGATVLLATERPHPPDRRRPPPGHPARAGGSGAGNGPGLGHATGPGAVPSAA